MRHEIQHEVDLVGRPVVPPHLEQAWARMAITNPTLNPNGDAQAESEARRVYAAWKDNGYRHVTMSDALRTQRGNSNCNIENADFFDREYPEYEDYDNDIAYEAAENTYVMETAQAGEWCSDCPLRTLCLASSVTNERQDRSGYVHVGEVESTPVSIYGGYGPNARAVIADKVARMFTEEHGEVPEEYRPYSNSEGGFYGFDRDEYGAMLPKPTGLIKTGVRNKEVAVAS